MDTPEAKSTSGNALLIGIALAIGATAWACLSWSMYCRYIMGYIPFGLVLLPVITGVGAGFIMRPGNRYLRNHLGKITIAITIIGCILGDFLWIVISNSKPISVLLGTELDRTLRTLFAIDKLFFYAITAYLAFAIANPSRGVVTD